MKKTIDDSLGHSWRYICIGEINDYTNYITYRYICDKCKCSGYLGDHFKERIPCPLPIHWRTIKCEEIKFAEILA